MERIHPDVHVSVRQTRQDVPYFTNFITNSWLDDLEYMSQGQRSLTATHLLMLMFICAKHEKNPSIPVNAVEWKQQDVLYISGFIATWSINNLDDIGQGQRSFCATQHPMLMIISAKYGKSSTHNDLWSGEDQLCHILAVLSQSHGWMTWNI